MKLHSNPKALSDLRIIFMGTSPLAKEILAYLVENKLTIVSVITRPDKPAGRRRTIFAPPVKQYAEKKMLPARQFEKLDAGAIDFFQSQKPDLVILAAYGSLLPQELLKIPVLGCVNVHPSLLPKYRGPAPLQATLLAGDSTGGVSIMLMNEKMDAGPILAQEQIKIKQSDCYPDLEKKAIKLSNKLLLRTIEKWINGEIRPVPQDDRFATYSRLVTKEDGSIDWDSPSGDIYNQYRAFSAWPKIFSTMVEKNGKRKNIVFDAIGYDSLFVHNRIPGEVFRESSEILIAAGRGVIVPKTVRLEGKNNLPIKDFANGRPDFIGSVLGR